MKFYTTEKITSKRSFTPEGFMVIESAPLARTGMMIYGPDETPVGPGPDGVTRIERDPDEVFRPETIASFAGKPAVNDHPEEDVTPENYKELAIGHILNPRRGEGDQDDLMVGDIVITDKQAMIDIESGKRDLSCGYSCDYMEDEDRPGYGWQKNIIGNHVALVDSGRCGSRCAIVDAATITKESHMRVNTKDTILNRIRRAFVADDKEELEKAMKDAEKELEPKKTDDDTTEMGEGGPEIHLHAPAHDGPTRDEFNAHVAQNAAEHKTYDERLKALEGAGKTEEDDDAEHEDEHHHEDEPVMHDDKEIEGQLEEEAPDGTGDKARKANDSSYLVQAYRNTAADAEVIAPGVKMTTFDRKAKPVKSLDAICTLRRRALDSAFKGDNRAIIEHLTGGRALNTKKMTCDSIRTMFNAAVAMKKQSTNDTTVRGVSRVDTPSTAPSLSDINAANRKRFEKEGVK